MVKYLSRRGARLGRALAAPLVLAGVLTGLGPVAGAPAATCQTWAGGQPPSPGNVNNRLLSVTVLSACNAWAVGFSNTNGLDATLVEHWDGSSWSILPSPSPGPFGAHLDSVRAVSPASIWAVGDMLGTEQDTLVEHWNGRSWAHVASPSPGSADNELAGVAAASPASAWAVGTSFTSGAFQTLAIHCC